MELLREKVHTFLTYQNKENSALLESIKHYQGIHYDYSRQTLKKTKNTQSFQALQQKYAFYQEYVYNTIQHFLANKNLNYYNMICQVFLSFKQDNTEQNLFFDENIKHFSQTV